MKKVNIHLVSDSTGETLSSIAKAVFSQFDQVEAKEYIWSLIRTKGQLEKILEKIREKRGIVMSTITDKTMTAALLEECKRLEIPCMSVLDSVISNISGILGVAPNPQPGKQYVIDDEYFQKIEAMNFSITHDDGQHAENLDEAEIVLIGPSRTSKSPTSMYLAHRGFKTANVPYVSGCPLPDNIYRLKNPLIVGMSITPARLVEIRKSRLLSISDHKNSEYIDIEKVEKEMLEARRIFAQNRWPVIDITRKSVEEISANIVQLYHDKRKADKR